MLIDRLSYFELFYQITTKDAAKKVTVTDRLFISVARTSLFNHLRITVNQTNSELSHRKSYRFRAATMLALNVSLDTTYPGPLTSNYRLWKKSAFSLFVAAERMTKVGLFTLLV